MKQIIINFIELSLFSFPGNKYNGFSIHSNIVAMTTLTQRRADILYYNKTLTSSILWPEWQKIFVGILLDNLGLMPLEWLGNVEGQLENVVQEPAKL